MRSGDHILRKAVAVATMSLLLIVFSASGQESMGSDDERSMDTQDGPGMLGLVAQLLFSLILVALLIWGVLYGVKRFSGRTLGGRFRGGIVEVLERAFIAPKKAIYLVKIGDRILALSVTDSDIRVLLELPLEETLELYSKSAQGDGTKALPTFLQNLRDRMGSSTDTD